MCVLLAQGFVFLGEEGLTFQVRGADLTKTNTQSVVERPHVSSQHRGSFETFCSTYRAHEAGVVPGEPQSLQELVPGLDGEIAAVAVGPKQVVEVCVSRLETLACVAWRRRIFLRSLGTFFTVRLPVLHVEHAVSDGLLTGDADEAGHVPGLLQGIHDVLRGGQIKTSKSSG